MMSSMVFKVKDDGSIVVGVEIYYSVEERKTLTKDALLRDLGETLLTLIDSTAEAAILSSAEDKLAADSMVNEGGNID